MLLVVVPARNEERSLGRVLRALTVSLEYARRLLGIDYRVVVVDDASTDSTPEIARGFAENNPRAYYLRLSHSHGYDSSAGVVRTVRAGILYAEKTIGAKWEFFMQVDADTLLYPSYTARVVGAMLEDSGIGVAGGVTVNEPTGPLHVRNTGMTVRRKVWEECRGYRAFPAPDTVIQLCAVERGWRIARITDAKMIVLRPTRINYYRSGLVDSATGSKTSYALLKALAVAARTKNPRSLVAYAAGYLAGRLNRESYQQVYLPRAREVVERARLKARLEHLAKI